MGKEYDLIPILNTKQKTFQIKEFDEVKEACESFIKKNLAQVNLEVLDRENFGYAKNIRTEIRKKQESIKRVRIDCNELSMGIFNKQTKELEAMLKEADEKLKAFVDKFAVEVKNVAVKPKKITLEVKGYDMKVIEKVKAFAIKQGLEVAAK